MGMLGRGNAGVWRCWCVRMLACGDVDVQGVCMLVCWYVGMLVCWCVGMLECLDVGVWVCYCVGVTTVGQKWRF